MSVEIAHPPATMCDVRIHTIEIVDDLTQAARDLRALDGAGSSIEVSKNSSRQAEISRELLRLAHELDFARVQVMDVYHNMRSEKAARDRHKHIDG